MLSESKTKVDHQSESQGLGREREWVLGTQSFREFHAYFLSLVVPNCNPGKGQT